MNFYTWTITFAPVTHFRLNKPVLLHPLLLPPQLSFGYVRLCDLDIPSKKMAKLFANSGNPNQTLHSAASDPSLHHLD